MYPDAPCDVALCSLALLSFKRDHRCGDTMFKDMLALIKSLLPVGNEFPGTAPQVFSSLNLTGEDAMAKISHHFCPNECIEFDFVTTEE